MDFPALARLCEATQTAVEEATEGLRVALAEASGCAAGGPGFAPLAPLGEDILSDRVVFAALGPTQPWTGWALGETAWAPLHELGLQALSPWFGWYAPNPAAPMAGQSPEKMTQMADRLELLGFPLLVWLEPEYALPGLVEELGEEAYLHDAQGRWQASTRINNTINVFNPRVREALADWLEDVATGQRDDGRFLGYELIEEAALRFDVSDPNNPIIEPHLGGYSQSARKAFRARLESEYGNIAALNTKWGSDYATFTDVAPPAELRRAEGEWSRPEVALLVEFQEFRAAEHAEYFRQLVGALHRGAPDKPVLPQFTTSLFGDPLGGVDLFRMAEAGFDIVTYHTETAFPYVYSLARRVGKPLWNDEYIWSNLAPREATGEQALRAVASTNLWRNLMWGARGFVLFNLDFAWNHPKDGGDWNNDLLNPELGHLVPRYAAGAFPQALRKPPTFFEELYNSEVVNEGLLVLEPTTSVYAAVPTGTSQWWARRLTEELTGRFYRPAFCPERYLADGSEDLTAYRTVVVPAAPYLPEAVAEALWKWVNNGGTLIALGPFATRDEYGRTRPPEAPFAAIMPGETLTVGEGQVVSVAYSGAPDAIIARAAEAVDSATGARACWSDAPLELMLRALPDGRLLLIALNPSSNEQASGAVFVSGDFQTALDITVEGRMPLVLQKTSSAVALPIALAPGEARALWLR